MPDRRRLFALLALAAIGVCFVAATWIRAGKLGYVGEEVEPYLDRYPHTLERFADGGRVMPMPPYDAGRSAPRPRWVSTSQWPVIAYDGVARMWPVFIRGHQSAIGAYPGLALGPLLGQGMLGVRRADALLALALLLATAWLGLRLAVPWTPLGVAIMASSYGLLWLARTGYGFELASRIALVVALALAAPLRRPSLGTAIGIGAAVAIATLCRATIAVTLAPALAVLLFRPARAPGTRQIAALALTAVALPLAVFMVVHAVAPFRPGEGALAAFPFAEAWARLRTLPLQAVLQLAWLGDASAIMGSIVNGSRSLGWPGWAAALGSVPFAAAFVRWRRGRATDIELALLWAAGTGIVLGAAMYRTPHNFQLAFGLEPLFGLSLAAQIRSLTVRPASFAGVATMALRLVTATRGLSLESQAGNPAMSARAQRDATHALLGLGIPGDRLATVTYNQTGVVEAWSDGAIRPWHAWKILEDDDADVRDAWHVLLTDYGVQWVLFSDADSVIDDPRTRRERLWPLLESAASEANRRVLPVARFATESGGPGWTLAHVEPAL